MASAKDDVFLKVEAVLSCDWLKNAGRDLTKTLEEIENLGIESISFSRGNYVLVGSLDQLVRIREHFLGREGRSPLRNAPAAYSPLRGNDYMERWTEPQRNNSSRDRLFSVDREREALNAAEDTEWAVNSKDRPNSGRDRDPPRERRFSKELMVDNDIWEYIEKKKSGELSDLETMFAASLSKAEDDSGVLKIAIKPKSNDTTSEEVGIMHETLVGIYQETFMRCVIEKHEVHFSDEEAELVLEYIAEKFPDVCAKRCIYNDDFLFIGPPQLAREARQQFQVLAQRLKRGQLKTKMDNRAVFEEYGRRGRLRDRYEDDPYKEPPYEFTNNFQNVPDEDVVVKDGNRQEFFDLDEGRVEDEGRLVYPDAPKEPYNELSDREEEDLKVEERKPELSPSEDPDILVIDWNRQDKNKREKPADDHKYKSGATSLIYWRQENDEDGVAKRSSSDVEDDDWKKEVSTKNHFGMKKRNTVVDELGQEMPDREFEASCETINITDVELNADRAAASASSSYDNERLSNDEPELEGARAAKSQENAWDREKEHEQYAGPILKEDLLPARIDANSVNDRPIFSQARAELPSKVIGDFVYKSSDEKTGSSESLEKKPEKTRKKTYNSGPKVKIMKPTLPDFAKPVDATQKVVVSEPKVVSLSKVVGERSSGELAAGEATASRAAKISHREVLGAPSRAVGELEKLELEEVFRTQRRGLKKMPFDSESSEDDADSEREVAKRRRGRKEGKEGKDDHQRIEELLLRGDEASQKLLQSLLEKETEDASRKERPDIDNGRVVNDVVDEAMLGGVKPKVIARAAERPAASGRRTRAKTIPTVGLLQPPDGNIGCVIDKAFHLPGHDKSGTIEINISFEAGDQADDQSEPGRAYKAMTMKAFLPASGDGRETLRLMKAAFTARKLFTLQDTGDLEDTIVPNRVTFKDSADSYPDPGYLPQVMEQLRLLTDQQ